MLCFASGQTSKVTGIFVCGFRYSLETFFKKRCSTDVFEEEEIKCETYDRNKSEMLFVRWNHLELYMNETKDFITSNV